MTDNDGTETARSGSGSLHDLNRFEEARRREALGEIRLSDVQAEALAATAKQSSYVGPDLANHLPAEELAQRQESERRQQRHALKSFKSALLDREVDAY